MRSNCLARRKKYLIIIVTFLTSTFLFYRTVQTSALKDNSLSRKFVLFNKSDDEENTESLPDKTENSEKENIQEKESADVDNPRQLSLTDDNKDLNSEPEKYDNIGEKSFDSNNDSKELPVDSGHVHGEGTQGTNSEQEKIDNPVTEPTATSNYSIENSGSEEKFTWDSPPDSDLTDPPKFDDLSSIDWHQLTIEEIDEIYSRNKKVIEKTMHDRRANMLSVCGRIKPNVFNRPYLFHFQELKLSWCPTYKAGSTTWKDYFVKRFVDPHIDHPDLKRLWKFKLSVSIVKPQGGGGRWADGRKKYRSEGSDTIRFTVVRNPVVRIISYWKMARACGEFVRVGMHKDILLSRHLPDPDQRERFIIEFDKYVLWCEEQVAGNTDIVRPTISEDNPYLNPSHITFPELVDKMQKQRAQLKTNDWEGHWAPASEWCDVCTHKLDYVAKLENEPWELWFLVDTLGLWEDREQFLGLKNMASESGKPSNEDEMAKFVSLLSDSQIKFLNSFYDNDFVMFSYDKIA